MTREDLFVASGGIDDALINRSEKVVKKIRNPSWYGMVECWQVQRVCYWLFLWRKVLYYRRLSLL